MDSFSFGKIEVILSLENATSTSLTSLAESEAELADVCAVTSLALRLGRHAFHHLQTRKRRSATEHTKSPSALWQLKRERQSNDITQVSAAKKIQVNTSSLPGPTLLLNFFGNVYDGLATTLTQVTTHLDVKRLSCQR